MQVHPLYDINNQVWVAGRVVARTLRELQEKLPKAKIVGYYPEGYVENRSDWEGAQEALRKAWRPVYQVPTSIKVRALDREIAEKQKKEDYYAKQKAEYERIKRSAEYKDATGKRLYVFVDHEAILELRGKGKTPIQIQRKLGCSHATVRRHLDEAKDAGDARVSVPFKQIVANRPSLISMAWKEADDAQLRLLLTQGYKDTQIAKLMGRTRNSIIGRRHRLKLKAKLTASVCTE